MIKPIKVIKMTEKKEKFEELFDREFIKLDNECYTIFDTSEKVRTIVDSVEKIINCYPTSSIFIKVEWVRFVLYNLFPIKHRYKNEFETTMEIIRACETNGYARENKRLRRLLKLKD